MVVGVLLFGALLVWDAVLQPKPKPVQVAPTPPRVEALSPARPQAPLQQEPARPDPSLPVQPAPNLAQPEQTGEPARPIPLPEPSAQILEPEAQEIPPSEPEAREIPPNPVPSGAQAPLQYRPQPMPKGSSVATANPTPNTEVVIPGQATPSLILRRWSNPGPDKAIALTFDDGPNPGYTEQVLEILRAHQVRATFFWLGRMVKAHPDLARAVVAEGHAVGNHTWNHRTAQSDEATAQAEIEETSREIEQASGVSTKLFRPPGGRLNNGLSDWALRGGYTVVMWSVQSNDWEKTTSAQDIVQNVLQAVQPGTIVLLHDGGGDRSRTAEALPQIIEALQAQGYRFVTIPELLELQTTVH